MNAALFIGIRNELLHILDILGMNDRLRPDLEETGVVASGCKGFIGHFNVTRD